MRKADILRQLHWQCWRADAPPLETPLADLVEVLPVLIESGSVGLVWPRLWHRADELGAVGAALAAAYESQVAHNARVERDIARVVTRLRDAGVEPVLIKGLAVARLYPVPLVRPAGDIDLVVRDEEYDAAKAALASEGVHLSFHGDPESRHAHAASAATREADSDVDLHRFSTWGEATSTDFFRDAVTVNIGGIGVRVPKVEDHLRALCLHFLRHAGVRPVRLCDIGILMETTTGCEWDQALRGTARETEQVKVTLHLAYPLLGASLNGVPARVREQLLPEWLTETVLRHWAGPPATPGPVLPEIMANPRGIVRTFTLRWPDPITATIRAGAPFLDDSRFLVATVAYLRQMSDFAIHRLSRQASEQRSR